MALEDYERALTVIDETLALGPPPEIAGRLTVLRIRVKQDILQSLYLDALIVLDEDRVALGTPITGQILLVNLSPDTLTIPADSGGTRSTMQLEMRYTEHDLAGNVLREKRQQPVLIGEDIVLEPGDRHSEPIVIDSLQFGPNRINYRTYELEAVLYPSEIRIGDEPWPGNLRFRTATCHVFPRNYEHLADQPLVRLDEAIAKNSPPHVPLAAALITERERPRAIDALVEILRRDWSDDPDPPTRLACCVGLRILTGEEISPRPDLWLEWADSR